MTSAPPTTISAVDLWTRLAQSTRPFRVVDFPRTDADTGAPIGKLAIVVLTQAEIMTCHAAAEGYAQEMLKRPELRQSGSLGYEDLYRDAKVCEMLTRACRRVDENGKVLPIPLFATAKDLRNQLVPNEIAVLISAYIDWQQESGPIVGSMTQDEMDAWLELLKEGGSRLPLARLSSEARTDLLMRSVSLLRTSSTASTSSGSPPEASSPSTDETAEPPPAPEGD